MKAWCVDFGRARTQSVSRYDRAGPRSAVATIVGVAGDVRPLLQRDTGPQIYVSYLQQSEPNIALLVRTKAGAAVPTDAIKHAVWSVVPDQPLYEIRPMGEVVEQTMSQPRLVARLLAGFALLAVVMSTMGEYTVVADLTARRTREVALRRAIGAESLDVLQLLATQTLRWTVAGLAIGIAGAAAATNLLRTVVLGAAHRSRPPSSSGITTTVRWLAGVAGAAAGL